MCQAKRPVLSLRKLLKNFKWGGNHSQVCIPEASSEGSVEGGRAQLGDSGDILNEV